MMHKLALISVGLLCGAAAGSAQNLPALSTDKVKTVTIPYKLRYVFSRTLRPGQVKAGPKGADGKKTLVIRVTRTPGKTTEKVVATKIIPAKDQIMQIGRGGYEVSRSGLTGSKILTMVATAYDPHPSHNGGSGLTATGIPARFGVAAVDPRVIKLNTLLFIEGYGFALAADTGGAIKGNKIDLCYNTEAECIAFGRRKVVVHIISSPS